MPLYVGLSGDCFSAVLLIIAFGSEQQQNETGAASRHLPISELTVETIPVQLKYTRSETGIAGIICR